MGTNCEITPCDNIECKNEGHCVVKGIFGVCECLPGDNLFIRISCKRYLKIIFLGYSGLRCEKDPCSSHSCSGGGYCELQEHRAVCICDNGFSGKFCELTPCTDYDCKNGGTCQVQTSVYSGSMPICVCKNGYSGDSCEKGPCFAEPCKNSGICSESENAESFHECICPDGYSVTSSILLYIVKFLIKNKTIELYKGFNCEITPCSSNPCGQFGECKNTVNGYECSCFDGVFGKNCQIPPCENLDVTEKCHNDGVCKNMLKGMLFRFKRNN